MVFTVLKYRTPESNRKETIQVIAGDFNEALEKISKMYPDYISIIYEKSRNS